MEEQAVEQVVFKFFHEDICIKRVSCIVDYADTQISNFVIEYLREKDELNNGYLSDGCFEKNE